MEKASFLAAAVVALTAVSGCKKSKPSPPEQPDAGTPIEITEAFCNPIIEDHPDAGEELIDEALEVQSSRDIAFACGFMPQRPDSLFRIDFPPDIRLRVEWMTVPFDKQHVVKTTDIDMRTVMKDPEIVALKERFRAEAEKQIARVKEAGGFCKIPPKQESPDAGEDTDDRLGNELKKIVDERDAILKRKYPDFSVAACREYIAWKVSLGRAECETVEPVDLSQTEIPTDKRKEVEKKLEDLRRRFNMLCAVAQDGLLNHPSIDDDLALARVIMDRNRLLLENIPQERVRELQQNWRATCQSDLYGFGAERQPGTNPLTPSEQGIFLSSDFANILSDTWWECSQDYSILRGNFERDQWCGTVKRCQPFKGAKPKGPWGQKQGTLVEVPTSPRPPYWRR